MTSDAHWQRWSRDGRRGLLAILVVVTAMLATFGRGVSGADTAKEKPPACMRCGATCGLEPICICKPGTKKKPVTEFETKCEPICVAGCSGPPWARRATGCTECPPDECCCPGWVRNRKVLVAMTRHEEVATVERSVGYVCGRCTGRGGAGCCDPEPVTRANRWPSWWPVFLRP